MAASPPKSTKVHDINFALTAVTRDGIRAEMASAWLKEAPGNAVLRNCYRYFVETLQNNDRIYLLRPAGLNNGIDFKIYCEGFTKHGNGNNRPPSHKDLLGELAELAQQSTAHGDELRGALRRIWECVPPNDVCAALGHFQGSLRAERSLKLARWFFIEQDVTYWTGSGRHMLRSAVEDVIGAL
jgi:hypothetical protein